MKIPTVYRHLLHGLLFIYTILFSALALAEVNSKEVTVSGYGESRDDAVASALLSAVQQSNGIKVETTKLIESHLFTIVSQSRQYGHEEIKASSQRKVDFLGATKGIVESYDIISEKNQGSSAEKEQWQVVLKVKLLNYVPSAEQQARQKLPTLAIVPFRIHGNTAITQSISDSFNHQLTSQIINAGQFRVLDRIYVDEYSSEIAALQSPHINTAESLRLGQKLGADYLLVGIFDNFNIEENKKDMYGSEFVSYALKGEVRYRLLDVASGEVRMADMFKPAYTSQQISSMLHKDYFAPKSLSESRADAMIFISTSCAEKINNDLSLFLTKTKSR